MSAILPLLAPRSLALRGGTNHLAYSPDGELLATSDTGMLIEVKRADEVVFSVSLAARDDKVRPTERVRGVRFSHDGRLLYVAAGDRMTAFDVGLGIRVWDYRPPRSFGFLIISPIAVATSLGFVAAAFDNGSFAIWDDGGQMRALWHENDCPRFMGFLPDGDRLVGSDSFGLGVWNVQTRRREHKARISDRVYGLATKPDQALVALRTLHHVLIYDADAGEMRARLPIGAGLPLAAFHPTERVLALGDRFGVNVVDLEGGFIERYNTRECSVLSIAFSPDGSRLSAGLSDRTVSHWDFAI